MATNLKFASSGRPGNYVIDNREAGTFRVACEAFTGQAVF